MLAARARLAALRLVGFGGLAVVLLVSRLLDDSAQAGDGRSGFRERPRAAALIALVFQLYAVSSTTWLDVVVEAGAATEPSRS